MLMNIEHDPDTNLPKLTYEEHHEDGSVVTRPLAIFTSWAAADKFSEFRSKEYMAAMAQGQMGI